MQINDADKLFQKIAIKFRFTNIGITDTIGEAMLKVSGIKKSHSIRLCGVCASIFDKIIYHRTFANKRNYNYKINGHGQTNIQIEEIH